MRYRLWLDWLGGVRLQAGLPAGERLPEGEYRGEFLLMVDTLELPPDAVDAFEFEYDASGYVSRPRRRPIGHVGRTTVVRDVGTGARRRLPVTRSPPCLPKTLEVIGIKWRPDARTSVESRSGRGWPTRPGADDGRRASGQQPSWGRTRGTSHPAGIPSRRRLEPVRYWSFGERPRWGRGASRRGGRRTHAPADGRRSPEKPGRGDRYARSIRPEPPLTARRSRPLRSRSSIGRTSGAEPPGVGRVSTWSLRPETTEEYGSRVRILL